MKIMQSGMQMMSTMSQDGRATGMGAMGAAPGSPRSAPNQPGAAAMAGMNGMNGMMTMHGAMERRMALMEQMMQMMVDREAAMPRRLDKEP